MFKKKKSVVEGSRQPSERKQITDNLGISLWQSERTPGQYHWDMSRHGRDGATFATKRIEDILEIPSWLAHVAGVFASHSPVQEDLREELFQLSAALYEMLEKMEATKASKVMVNGSGNGVFAAS